MVSLSHPKSPISLHIFPSMNKSSPSSSSSSPSPSPSSLTPTMKLKAHLHNLIFSHFYRIARAFSKAKSIILNTFKGNNHLIFLKHTHKKNKHIFRNKILFGSFRLHYNWCSSSHVLPISSPSDYDNIIHEGKIGTTTTKSHIYYDSSWNSMLSTNEDEDEDHHQGQFGHLGNCKERDDQGDEGGELSSYLQWLEDQKRSKEENNNSKDDDGSKIVEDEIDMLADKFIASCHEKFRLEKIESYRRYQAMLARLM